MKKQITIITFSSFFFLFLSCNQEEIHSYLGENCIQFVWDETKYEGDGVAIEVPLFFSFVYSGSATTQDTAWINAHISGDIYMHKRYYRIKGITSYTKYFIRDSLTNLITDTVLVELPNQAKPGKHYLDFSDAAYDNLWYVDSNRVDFKVPIILFRDASLLENEYTLRIEFEATEDFQPGNQQTITRQIVISDQYEEPDNWYSTYFGDYGPVKHKFMIQVTQKPWNEEFIEGLSDSEMLYYKFYCTTELLKLNEARAAEGKTPLREDPNDPSSIVEFP